MTAAGAIGDMLASTADPARVLAADSYEPMLESSVEEHLAISNRSLLVTGAVLSESHHPPATKWRGRRVKISIDQATHRLKATLEAGGPMALFAGGKPHHLAHDMARLAKSW